MAYENYAGTSPVTVPASATGLPRWRFCRLSTAANTQGQAALGTSEVSVFGVIIDGTTGSTVATNITCSVQTGGIAKVSAGAADTLAAGDLVACGTGGKAVPLAAGDYAVGRVVAGSSGAINRVLSISLEPIGTT